MPTLLVVDDDRAVHAMIGRAFEASPDLKVLSASTAAAAVTITQEQKPDVVLLDVMLPETSGLEIYRTLQAIDPRAPIVFITAGGSSETAIEAMKLGAFDYLLKPLDLEKVRDLVARALEIRRLSNTPVAVPAGADLEGPGDFLVGRSAPMQEVYKSIGRVASQDVTVLVRGDSGTGKELVARAIYQHSERARGPFLAVNCAAIPEALLESELFGHEKGAFTGAERQRIGKFEQCSGGTIFLDEVGDMSPLVQSKVLRLLQEQQFSRVGGNENITTDVRIVAATNRDLEKMVANNEFREDLFYRLNGFTIDLPPLRERGDDLLLLLDFCLRRFAKEFGREIHGFSPEAIRVLTSYAWPGNVRELQSVVRQALLQATGSVIMPEFLPAALTAESAAKAAVASADGGTGPGLLAFVEQRMRAGTEDLYAECLEVMERLMITRVLQEVEGNQSHAAKILGITRGSLRNKIRTLGIFIGQMVTVDSGDE